MGGRDCYGPAVIGVMLCGDLPTIGECNKMNKINKIGRGRARDAGLNTFLNKN